ncbi:MAG: hypothetical protein Q8R83_08210 [Legionellaceae bacterium]|nr:hypothetical protein [Legionellaceae bacterium]
MAEACHSGFGITTPAFTSMLKTSLGKKITHLCDMKLMMQPAHIKSYMNAFSFQSNANLQKYITSFEEPTSARYYEILIEAGKTHSFHRFFPIDIS